MIELKLLRLPEIARRLGSGRSDQYNAGHSAIYRLIREGLWPPFVKIGRASVLPEHECDAMLRAIVAGAPDDQRRALVQQLVAQRQQPASAA